MFRGEESLTAPVLEMLLKLIIYASELLAKPSDNWYSFHRTAGMFLVSPLLVLTSASLLSKMLSHFHQQKFSASPVSGQTADFRSRSRSVLFPAKTEIFCNSNVPHLALAVPGTTPAANLHKHLMGHTKCYLYDTPGHTGDLCLTMCCFVAG